MSILDGVFNSTDLVKIFQANEYEDSIDGNSTWAEGDWNCDGDFSTADLILAFQQDSYSAAATVAHSPNSNVRMVAARIESDSASSDQGGATPGMVQKGNDETGGDFDREIQFHQQTIDLVFDDFAAAAKEDASEETTEHRI